MARGDGSRSRPGRLAVAGAAVVLAWGMAGCETAWMHLEHDPEFRPAKRRPIATVDDERHAYLVLRLGERRLYLMDAGEDARRVVESYPVAVGREGYQTPTGRFQVKEKLHNPDWVQIDWNEPSRVIRRIPPGPTNPLGVRWIGFASAYGWEIGFHGTPNPELLGQAVSHGCVRMRNADIARLYDRIRLGTPVIVEP